MSTNEKKTEEVSSSDDDEDCINLCDDHDYQVLSAVFETEKGNNVAEILEVLTKKLAENTYNISEEAKSVSKNLFVIRKDIHSMSKEIKLLARSVHNLIQLSLVAKMNEKNDDDSDEDSN